MPLFIYILDRQKTEEDYKRFLKIILKSTIIWFIGYIFTWMSKWVIYDILYQEGLIKSAIIQVFYRTERYNPNSALQILEELKMFLLNNTQYILILTIVMISAGLISINNVNIKIKKLSQYIKENLPFLVISLMPLVWYIVLANHTILHPRFVYRHMLIFLFGIIICIKNIVIVKKKEKIKES